VYYKVIFKHIDIVLDQVMRSSVHNLLQKRLPQCSVDRQSCLVACCCSPSRGIQTITLLTSLVAEHVHLQLRQGGHALHTKHACHNMP
jgi:hypothetical protein